jgi:hypothetical protein
MIHPTIRAEVGARSLTLLKQAAEIIEQTSAGEPHADRWLAEYREMVGHTDLLSEVEAKLRDMGVIE